MWDHPTNQTENVAAKADLFFYFILKPEPVTKNPAQYVTEGGVRGLKPSRFTQRTVQTGRVTFTSHCVTVGEDVCAVRQKYSWLGRQTETATHGDM